MAHRLVVMDGTGVLLERRIEPPGRITIGRRNDNNIVLEGAGVSACHAVISFSDGETLIEDLNSTNGTKVNGQPVHRHFLQPQDEIAVAGYRIHLRPNHVDPGEDAPWFLEVLDGPRAGTKTVLDKPISAIGDARGPHVLVVKGDRGYTLTPAGPGTPVTVNGRPNCGVEDVLRPGDVIQLINIRVTLRTGRSDVDSF